MTLQLFVTPSSCVSCIYSCVEGWLKIYPNKESKSCNMYHSRRFGLSDLNYPEKWDILDTHRLWMGSCGNKWTKHTANPHFKGIWNFRKLFFKAQSPTVSFHWNVAKETLELWALGFETAFENVTPWKWDRLYIQPIPKEYLFIIFLFVCLFVGIKPEKLYSASCVGREKHPLGVITHGQRHKPRAYQRQRERFHLWWNFRKALSKFKAQSSNVSFQRNVVKETFELWAFSFERAFRKSCIASDDESCECPAPTDEYESGQSRFLGREGTLASRGHVRGAGQKCKEGKQSRAG